MPFLYTSHFATYAISYNFASENQNADEKSNTHNISAADSNKYQHESVGERHAGARPAIEHKTRPTAVAISSERTQHISLRLLELQIFPRKLSAIRDSLFYTLYK